MNSMESSTVPPGFRFHPTDEELVGYYLRKKVASQKIDLDVIRDIDLYRIEPWDLQERCRIGYEEQNEWYFFSHKDKKYPKGTRTNRATLAGFWKATGRDKAVYDKTRLIGMRKTLVFYKGRAPNGQKSDWIMHEYCLESDDNGPPQEEGWVVCRAFKKRATGSGQSTKALRWESNYFYDEPSGSLTSNAEPITDYISRNPHHQPQTFLAQNNFLCKQEIEADNSSPNFNNNIIINNINYNSSDNNHNSNNDNDLFVQLPPLESPSLPLIKRPSSVSLVSEINEEDIYNNNKKLVTTDWRALDKFVASQLCQDQDRFSVVEGDKESSFRGGVNLDQDFDTGSFNINGTNKLMSSVFLSSTDEEVCDFGICVFEN